MTEHVAVVAEPVAEPGDDAVAEAGEQVVVHALGDPGGQQRVGEVLAQPRVRVAQHLDELDRELVEGAVHRHLAAGLHHGLPVRLGHLIHCARRPVAFIPALPLTRAHAGRHRAHSRRRCRTDDVAWLHALVTDWQIIADLAFSDLVLWVPDAESKGLWAAAQIRPTTGPTTLLEDVVGTFVPAKSAPALQHALESGELGESVAADDHEGAEVYEELVPLLREGAVCGVVVLRSVASGHRLSSALEATYRESAANLVQMIHRGEFPPPGTRSDLADSLRVGDGFVRTGADGLVTYASPNAMSAYRRLGLVGDLVGADLSAVTAGLVGDRPTDRGARGLLAVGAPGRVGGRERRPRRCCCASSRSCTTSGRPARSCCCATSPSCGCASASWSRRRRRSGRSTTG